MQRQLLHGKIHRATVTEAQIDYAGSLTVDPKLLEAADIIPGEKVLIANLTNGARIESYCIEGERASGVVCMNGAAARVTVVGDRIIIISYVQVNEEELTRLKPQLVFVDERNQIRGTRDMLAPEGRTRVPRTRGNGRQADVRGRSGSPRSRGLKRNRPVGR